MKAGLGKKTRSRRTTLATAIQNGDMQSAKSEIDRLTNEKNDIPLAELPYLYASCVRDLLAGAELDETAYIPDHLLFGGVADVRVHLEMLADELCSQKQQQKTSNSLEDEIFAFVDERIFLPELSLSMVAEHFNQHKSVLSAMFKREKNMNYVDYINRTRVIRATQLMRNADSQVSLDAIGNAVGYISQTTFRRNFAKYTSCTPNQYRRLISR